MKAVWLIAGREFRAYTATTSFWVALMVGPALAAGALALTGGHAGPARPAASMTLAPEASGEGYVTRFSSDFPLSLAGRRRLVDLVAMEVGTGGPVRLAAPAEASPVDVRALSRFVLTLVLWMTLTGSLGMLLQAVVRERANRALESLLAAARPVEIVAGKLVGIGAVSALVVGAWIGAGAIAGVRAAGAGRGLLGSFSDLPSVLYGLGLYGLAFAFYGFVTVAVSARARDNADAQNLARPMFAVLLAVFFAALAAAGGAKGLDGLVFLPPFTPFMLLMRPVAPLSQAVALALLVLSTVLAGLIATASVNLDSGHRRLGLSYFGLLKSRRAL